MKKGLSLKNRLFVSTLNIEKSKARWAKWNALATYACKLSSENYANLATV